MLCKNILFNQSDMTEIHPTMIRLYKFAKDNKSIVGQTNLANALGESPQVVKNWETRGISQRGANLAQKKFGCDANWVLGRSNHPMHTAIEETKAHRPVVESGGAWIWPFKTVSAAQYNQLEPEEKAHIEADILLRVKNRGDPQKEEAPAPITANGQST